MEAAADEMQKALREGHMIKAVSLVGPYGDEAAEFRLFVYRLLESSVSDDVAFALTARSEEEAVRYLQTITQVGGHFSSMCPVPGCASPDEQTYHLFGFMPRVYLETAKQALPQGTYFVS